MLQALNRAIEILKPAVKEAAGELFPHAGLFQQAMASVGARQPNATGGGATAVAEPRREPDGRSITAGGSGRFSPLAAVRSPVVQTAGASSIQPRDTFAEQVTRLARGASLTLGRDPTQASITSDAPTVSRVHAHIFRSQNGELFLHNEAGKTTSVERQGKTIDLTHDNLSRLLPGDKIQLGGPSGQVFTVPDGTKPSVAPAMTAAPAVRQIVCQLFMNPVTARIAQLSPQRDGFLIGRAVGDTGVGDDSPVVSGRHARIFNDQTGKLMVSDMKSTNGTSIERGGQSINVKPGFPQALQAGDVLRLGGKNGPSYAI